MDLPELPLRIHTLGEEPHAGKSISYHTDDSKLFDALRQALHADEYEELKESKLRVFIKFNELNFGWASRLVHYMLGLQLDIKKKYKLWSLVGPQPVRFSLLEFEHLTGLNCDYIEDLENPRCEVTKEMAAFWEMLGVDVDAGPTTEQMVTAFGRCEEWTQDDRMRLGYLAIFIGFIKGRKYSTATRASLARLVMDLEKFENYPWGRVAFKFSRCGRTMLCQNLVLVMGIPYQTDHLRCCWLTRVAKDTNILKRPSADSVINFVQKNFGKMFPRWDFDIEDSAAENIIKVMFNAKPRWKWTMDCWEVTGTKPSVKKEWKKARKEARKEKSVEARAEASKLALTEARSEGSTTVGGMTKEVIEKSFRDIADAMRDGFGMCLKEIKLLGDRMEAVEKKVGITKKVTASNDLQITASNPPKRGHEAGSESVNGAKAGHNDAQEPSSSKELSLVIAKKPENIVVNLAFLYWTKENPLFQMYSMGKLEGRQRRLSLWNFSVERGNSTAKLIIPNKRVGQGYDPFAPFDKKMSNVLTDWYPEFKSDEGDLNVPTFCQSMNVLGVDVDDIYAPVNFRNEHWIAIWISIPKNHIVVWDNIISHISREDLDVVMEPFVTKVPYLLVECAGSDEQRVQHTLEPYTYERVTVGFCNKNVKAIREKMALDIFKETPECHSKENEDNDENMRTYDEQEGRRGVKSSGRLTRRSPSTYKSCVASSVCVLSS
ncbi:BnaC04g19560D [Brassica napus]|uniref:BnaC04g19560D protein n=1 Tax=Brassica napus TaxID=3708 RepID=A0A078F6B8_BRANA|nr:BnaC04g19560D [Brassica napus]